MTLSKTKALIHQVLVLGAGSAAGRLAKKTDGLVTAETNGTASIPQASAPLACISGLQHSVSLAPAGRRILIGMLTDANPTYSI